MLSSFHMINESPYTGSHLTEQTPLMPYLPFVFLEVCQVVLCIEDTNAVGILNKMHRTLMEWI